MAHNAIPVQLTPEDFDQVLTGNFVTKVIYLPDPEFQELAVAGVETLVSTRLDPGVDPIVEADRRGAILAVFRLGNKDLQLPSPAPMGVAAAGYNGMPGPNGMPGMPGVPVAAYGGTVPQNYIAGVTGPQWGMTMSGTPIGLPGPPHVPLGVPAGLQRYTIVNHTKVLLPEPTQHVRVDVKEPPAQLPAPGQPRANHRDAGARRTGLSTARGFAASSDRRRGSGRSALPHRRRRAQEREWNVRSMNECRSH